MDALFRRDSNATRAAGDLLLRQQKRNERRPGPRARRRLLRRAGAEGGEARTLARAPRIPTSAFLERLGALRRYAPYPFRISALWLLRVFHQILSACSTSLGSSPNKNRRSRPTATYFGSSSIARQIRPVCSAATSVVPLPENGS